MESIDWDAEVSRFFDGDKLDSNALLREARADIAAIPGAIDMNDTRSKSTGDDDDEDTSFLGDYINYARRALCKSGKPREGLQNFISSPISKAAIITLSELIWPEIPDEIRKEKNIGIALAFDSLQKGLNTFCKV